MSSNPTDGFTLYLRGADENGLRKALKPLGQPGDDGRFRLEDSEVWVTLAQQVAMVRIPYQLSEEVSRPLIARIHELATQNKLVLSDDVTSTRTIDQLMANLRVERERVGLMNPAIRLAKWSLGQRILFAVAAAGLLALAVWSYQQITGTAHIPGG